jgi:hypothetical protein
MMKRLLIMSALLAMPIVVLGQARPTDKFSWQQDETALTNVQAFRYELELDGTIQTVPLVTTCTGTTSPFDCSAPIPAITPTTHTVRIRAVDIGGSAPLVGDWSDAFSFTMKATPTKPTGIKIVPGN